MRALGALLTAALLAAGCGESQQARGPGIVGESPDQVPATEPAPPPTGLPGASCRNVNEGNPANFPEFVGVDVDSDAGVDRITFRFKPASDAPQDPPWHFVSFVEELVTEGEARPVNVEGEAFLLVSFQAIGVDLSSEEPVEVYTGPKRLTPAFGTLEEAVHLGDFEGQVTWGLGLSDRACFVLDAAPDHLTLEFPSSSAA
ncbi:MAG TPA: hypothetical protein VG602_08270 [Actinomycetota bacterium]|nr:hypothetical protein [Actinomycetota bacterium]